MISLSPSVAIVLRTRRRSLFIVPSLAATLGGEFLMIPLALVAVILRLVPVWTLPFAPLAALFVSTRVVLISRTKWSVWLALGPLPVWRLCVATHRPDFIGIDDHEPDPWDSDLLPPVFHRCVVEWDGLGRVYCFRPRALADLLNAEPGRLSELPPARSLPPS